MTSNTSMTVVGDILEISDIFTEKYSKKILNRDIYLPKTLLWASSVLQANPDTNTKQNGFSEAQLLTPEYTNHVMQELTDSINKLVEDIPYTLNTLDSLTNCMNDVYNNTIDYKNCKPIGS